LIDDWNSDLPECLVCCLVYTQLLFYTYSCLYFTSSWEMIDWFNLYILKKN
jgi:hypothetical protein